jgi:hypothetical protein
MRSNMQLRRNHADALAPASQQDVFQQKGNVTCLSVLVYMITISSHRPHVTSKSADIDEVSIILLTTLSAAHLLYAVGKNGPLQLYKEWCA